MLQFTEVWVVFLIIKILEFPTNVIVHRPLVITKCITKSTYCSCDVMVFRVRKMLQSNLTH